MLTGAALGKAIDDALILKKISKAELARLFKVKPPSVSGWISTGRISKPNFEKLRQLLADVVGPEHWGLPGSHTNTMIQDRSEYKVLSDDEWWLVLAYRQGDKNLRAGMLSLARTILPDRPAGFTTRTGT